MVRGGLSLEQWWTPLSDPGQVKEGVDRVSVSLNHFLFPVLFWSLITPSHFWHLYLLPLRVPHPCDCLAHSLIVFTCTLVLKQCVSPLSCASLVLSCLILCFLSAFQWSVKSSLLVTIYNKSWVHANTTLLFFSPSFPMLCLGKHWQNMPPADWHTTLACVSQCCPLSGVSTLHQLLLISADLRAAPDWSKTISLQLMTSLLFI